jgi:putative transposase
VPARHTLEFLTDNGAAYIAHNARRIARSPGLRSINTPGCSLQRRGMAEFSSTRSGVARKAGWTSPMTT